jgi:hypothetical protein
MISPKSSRIGAYTYTVTPLTAIPGRRAFVRLAKAVGPALGAAAGVKEGDDAGMFAAFAGLVAHLSEDDVDYFCDLFAANTTVKMGDKEPSLADIFDVHFAGRYLDMFRWLAFSVATNFGDFFAGLRAKAQAQAVAEAPMTPTPSA